MSWTRGVRQLAWTDLEEVAVSVVRQRYAALEDDAERRRFLHEIQRADWELGRLAKEIDLSQNARGVNYDAPCIAEAYTLRYHLPRADNALVVLREFDPLVRAIRAGYFRRLSYLLCKSLRIRRSRHGGAPVSMLDVGSGTGSGIMALWFDAHSFRVSYGFTDLRVTAVGVEPSASMRSAADAILGAVRDRLAEAEQLDAEAARATYTWEYASASNLEQAPWSLAPRQFDIILFSYTFGPDHVLNHEWTVTQALTIARRLRRGGRLLFLTPERPRAKVELMTRVAQALEAAGMLHWTSRLHGYHPHAWWHVSSLAPEKWPCPVVEACRVFNQECQRLGRPAISGGNPRFDHSYYGLYARCDVFAWKRGSDAEEPTK